MKNCAETVEAVTYHDLPRLWSRMQLDVISVVTGKNGIHRSSIREFSPKVSQINVLNLSPVNHDVNENVKSNSIRQVYDIFYWIQPRLIYDI
jgi:hypothetical protein